MTSGGLRRYVACLYEALVRGSDDDQFVLFGRPPNPSTFREKHWWLAGLPGALGRSSIDVFHGTNFEVPYLGSTPAVMTIHDLSPWRNQAWHHAAGRVRQRTPWLLKLGRTKRVLTPSAAVRNEAIERFGLRSEYVHVTALAAAPEFRPTAGEPLHTKPFFLFVGTLEPRKNIPGAIEAWRMAKTGADLILVGRKREDAPEIPDLPGLYWMGERSDSEIITYYSQALAFVYPSSYEGFGLPVLEAMQCGCPVITSMDPALTEVSGGAALHAGPIGEIANCMLRIASDQSLRQSLRYSGLERAKQFSWKRTAQSTYEVYREAMSR